MVAGHIKMVGIPGKKKEKKDGVSIYVG